ncbi:uncharacterized protein LOC112524267 [Cynara cardunculus var. scolymus]|uniref:uncharacterized protein LOC112524267 n=1 Tax=Cynara cardunculus var. scolymus TaxID=59895 RepID=UPI000D627198|nr:uncharacterized protein LOC112524267 [Cynara cardunculus var. scolymus]
MANSFTDKSLHENSSPSPVASISFDGYIHRLHQLRWSPPPSPSASTVAISGSLHQFRRSPPPSPSASMVASTVSISFDGRHLRSPPSVLTVTSTVSISFNGRLHRLPQLFFSISQGSESKKLIEDHLNKINKPFVKSIHSPDGDIIDCVLFHLQPAFDRLELKATVSSDPPTEPSNEQSKKGIASELKQKWSSKGESCPDGTIPIRRTREYEIFRSVPVSYFGKSNSASIKTNNIYNGHEHAIGYGFGEFYGAKATLNVWAPNVSNPSEFSLSHISISSDVPTDILNTITAGWQVSPKLGKDNSPRLFIYWTKDGSRSGCYNLLCSGFVQTSSKIALGAAIYPISTYNGQQFDISLLIWKEPKSGNWWLKVGSSLVGYWPATLFPNLQEKATLVEFGGEVYNGLLGPHTSAEMGSGHFSNEGFGKAAYIRNLEVIDRKHKTNPLSKFSLLAEKRSCYDITTGFADNWGHYIYFGGSGNEPTCT